MSYFNNAEGIEEWLYVPGYEGIYMASTYTRVKSIDRKIVRPNGVTVSCKGVMLYQRLRKTVGYLCVELSKNDERHHWLVHRIMAVTFIPNPLKLPIVNHKDGNRLNNSIQNLEWCTISYNQSHAYKNGLRKPMVDNKFGAKLLQSEVEIVRQRIKNGEYQRVIANDYGVSVTSISNIKTGKRWK